LEDVDGVLEMVQIEEEPPLVDGIQPMEIFVVFEKCYRLQRL
jgi:hypothetical protein